MDMSVDNQTAHTTTKILSTIHNSGMSANNELVLYYKNVKRNICTSVPLLSITKISQQFIFLHQGFKTCTYVPVLRASPVAPSCSRPASSTIDYLMFTYSHSYHLHSNRPRVCRSDSLFPLTTNLCNTH